MKLQTCRFCGKQTFGTGEMFRYALRCNAHFACYLDSGKTLADLKPWQVERFPYGILIERGLLAEALRICAQEVKA